MQDVVSKKAPQGKEDTPAAGLSVAQWMREVHRILLQIQASLSPLLLRYEAANGEEGWLSSGGDAYAS